jgi:RNA polymerase sigma-70 factor (family 1)
MLNNCYIRLILKTMHTNSSYSDLELTDFLKSGEKSAFIELYDRYKGLLYIYACKITKDKSMAEDMVQEVFIYLWEKRLSINFTTSISSYLYSAIRYKSFDLIDKQKVRDDYSQSFQLFIDQGEYLTDHYIQERELSAVIEKEILNLPPKMREIFVLSRGKNLTNQQIAKYLGISEKTVKNQVSLALKTLRVKLGLLVFLLFLINS